MDKPVDLKKHRVNKAAAALNKATADLLNAVPTTLHGVIAIAEYAATDKKLHSNPVAAQAILANIAKAIKTMVGVPPKG